MQRKDFKGREGLVLFSPTFMVIKMSQMAHFLYFLLMAAKKNSQSLGKIFKCIYKISFTFFIKRYVLFGFELPLARCEPLKIQDLGIFLLIRPFFCC